MMIHFGEGDPEADARIQSFKSGLPNGNVEIIPSYGDGKHETYQTTAHELVARNPDVLFASGCPSLRALQVATSSIPIVFAGAIDPVNHTVLVDDGDKITGLFSDNVTGFISCQLDHSGKLIDTLQKIAPNVARLAVIWDPSMHIGMGQIGAIVTATPPPLRRLTLIDVRGADHEIEDAVAAFAKTPNGGLIVTVGPLTPIRRHLIIRLAAQYRLPAVYPNSLYVRSGGLISYGDDTLDLYRQAGGYAHQILFNGKKPSELDIVTNCKFETRINQSTADALGLVVPTNLAH
jgi:putative ABC transport system substrate-binding protein